MSNLNAFVVRGADGSVDLDATTAKFRGALEVYVAEREVENGLIAAAVHEVFDQNPGASINMPALLNFASTKMGVTAANYSTLVERITAYIHESAVSETNPAGIFKISKGKGGGVKRVADIKPAS